MAAAARGAAGAAAVAPVNLPPQKTHRGSAAEKYSDIYYGHSRGEGGGAEGEGMNAIKLAHATATTPSVGPFEMEAVKEGAE